MFLTLGATVIVNVPLNGVTATGEEAGEAPVNETAVMV
jgi:hypothetical protein